MPEQKVRVGRWHGKSGSVLLAQTPDASNVRIDKNVVWECGHCSLSVVLQIGIGHDPFEPSDAARRRAKTESRIFGATA